MPNLDYDAVVPGLEDTKVAPFSVKTNPNMPPGDFGYKDFVPRGSVSNGPTKPREDIQRKNFQRKPSYRNTEDYVSPVDSAARRKSEKVKIIEIAREIYKSNRKHNSIYQESLVLVKESDEADLRRPDRKLERAMNIVKRYKPITKKVAVEKATQQFYGLSIV